jgi:hypothetical protein
MEQPHMNLNIMLMNVNSLLCWPKSPQLTEIEGVDLHDIDAD